MKMNEAIEEARTSYPTAVMVVREIETIPGHYYVALETEDGVVTSFSLESAEIE